MSFVVDFAILVGRVIWGVGGVTWWVVMFSKMRGGRRSPHCRCFPRLLSVMDRGLNYRLLLKRSTAWPQDVISIHPRKVHPLSLRDSTKNWEIKNCWKLPEIAGNAKKSFRGSHYYFLGHPWDRPWCFGLYCTDRGQLKSRRPNWRLKETKVRNCGLVLGEW